MSLIAKCACGKAFRAKPELAGKQIRCPACGGTLQVPAPAPAQPAPLQLLTPLPPADDPLGLGGLDLGASAPSPLAQSPLGAPLAAAAPRPARARQSGLPINPRVLLIVAGSVAGVVLLAVAAWVVWSLVGSSGGPAAVFATAKEAAQKEEWEKLCTCLTDESRDAMAGMLVAAAGMMRGFSGLAALGGSAQAKEVQAKVQPLVDVLNRHGLDEGTLKKLPTGAGMMGGPPAGDRLQQLLAPIKDRNRFIGDVIRAVKQLTNRPMPPPFQPDARLEGLKIDGDTATATMVQTVNGQERREPIKFRKVGLSWKIDIGMPGRL